jgi:hypothetical protein
MSAVCDPRSLMARFAPHTTTCTTLVGRGSTVEPRTKRPDRYLDQHSFFWIYSKEASGGERFRWHVERENVTRRGCGRELSERGSLDFVGVWMCSPCHSHDVVNVEDAPI